VLDIRATAYLSPVAEMDFASVPLTVRIANYADEAGLVTGKFRVYNSTTGTLIHTSEILPLSLAAGQSVSASALTDFDPPAPLDDTYFVVFDGHATNSLVPDGIGIFLGSFHFDVNPTGMGPAPAAHHTTHQLGGSDPIDVTGLVGAALKGAETHTSDATPTPDAAHYSQYALTALAEAAAFAAPSGVPVDGQKLIIRILDDSTPRALSWDAIYVDRGATLPATTVSDKTHYIGLIYNADSSTWDCVASTVEA
jgi:hypothetical protein